MLTIKESVIKNAGRGVFVNKSFNAGEYICSYAGKDIDISMLSNNEFTYSMNHPILKRTVRIGFIDAVDEEGVGQLINDSYMFELNDSYRNKFGMFSIKNTEQFIEDYIRKSTQKQNVAFKKGEDFRLYATKDITQGEELYLHYGIEYWITNIQIKTDEPLTKLFCFIKNKILYSKNSKYYLNNIIEDSLYILQVLRIRTDGAIMKAFDLLGKTPKQQLDYLIKIML